VRDASALTVCSQITVVEIKNVQDGTVVDTLDPYVELALGEKSATTPPENNAGACAKFDCALELPKGLLDNALTVRVWDSDTDLAGVKKATVNDDVVAECTVDLSKIELNKVLSFDLMTGDKKNGQIFLSFKSETPVAPAKTRDIAPAAAVSPPAPKPDVAPVSPSAPETAAEGPVNAEPVEVVVGMSNTPIDPQTCVMLGLPVGSVWGENATEVRNEYMEAKSKAMGLPSNMQYFSATQLAAMDTNNDGYVSVEEQQAWLAQNAAAQAFPQTTPDFSFQSYPGMIYSMPTLVKTTPLESTEAQKVSV